MSKRFPIDFSEAEHKALKRAAVEADMTMKAFIKAAVAEKIARPAAAGDSASVEAASALPPLHASGAERSAGSVLAEANEKPA